jgi:hypothetical protein
MLVGGRETTVPFCHDGHGGFLVTGDCGGFLVAQEWIDV